MKIEMGKKYETKAGEKVLIYSVAGGGDYSVHGAVDTVMGYRMCTWTHEGRIYEGEDNDSDLIELKEDWEILVEHFKNSEKPVMITIDSDVFRVVRIPELQLNEKLLEMIISSERRTTRQLKKDIKLATLEDCKKYILEK